MDTPTWRTRELVVEACARLDAFAHAPSSRAAAELAQLRVLLIGLGDETGDPEAADAARGVARDIDDALSSHRHEAAHRGAA